MHETLEHLKTTLEDRILTRSEKKALKSILDDKSFGRHDLNRLRSEIFDQARNHMNQFKETQIIDWLEEANKLLLPQEKQTFYCKSYFSPGTSCLNAILTQIGSAIKTIDICVFTISDNEIRDRIAYALTKGTRVRIITDDDKTMDMGSDIDFLYKKGAEIKTDSSPHHMHHKFAIFDNTILLTGSYNWTRSAAQNNQENILETNDMTAIRDYSKEFDRLWQTMEKYT